MFKKELQLKEEIRVETYSRQECCEVFVIDDSDDNIATIEGVIENVPGDSVIVFDEVPLESKTVKQEGKNARQKSSYDWSRLSNRRPTEVTAIVCLQPISQTPTNKHKSRAIIVPEQADTIELTKQYRSTKKLLKNVNDLCIEGLPLEYLNIVAKPSHEIQGPEVTLFHITEDTDISAFKSWLLYQMEKLGLDHSNGRIIFDPEIEKQRYNRKALGQAEELAKSTVVETKYSEMLATLGDVQGCEFPVVVVFFSNEPQSSLLEMCSRAQYKLFLVIIDNSDLVEGDALAASHSVTNEEIQKFSDLHKITKTEERKDADPKTFFGTRSKCEKGQQPVGDVAPVWIPKDRVSACQVTNLSSYDFDVAALPHDVQDWKEATPLSRLWKSHLRCLLQQTGSPQTPQP